MFVNSYLSIWMWMDWPCNNWGSTGDSGRGSLKKERKKYTGFILAAYLRTTLNF